MLVSQPVGSNFGKCVVYLGLSFDDFLFGLFEERICFRTRERVFNLLLLEASEKRDFLGARFYLVNGAGLRVVALRFEYLVIGNGSSLDNAAFELFGLYLSVFAG